MKLSDLYYEVSDFLDDYIYQARYEWGDKCVSDEVALALKEMKWHFDRNYVYEPIQDEGEYYSKDEWTMPAGGGGGKYIDKMPRIPGLMEDNYVSGVGKSYVVLNSEYTNPLKGGTE